ncbi:MAG: HEPN domain-containing protein [Candidatus Nanohalobium sp.]
MKDQKRLLEAAEDDLDTARYLLRGEKYNASISRAYYSIFHAAKALLLEENSKPKTHQGVSSELGKLFRDELEPEVTRQYSELQTWREEADYATGKQFNEEKAEEAVDFAEEFIHKVKQLIE